MTTINDGGPAFPGETVVRNGMHSTTRVNNSGMTKREWFAGMALAGYFAAPNTPHQNATDAAGYLVDMADAMIAALGGAK
ncbi:hypothetical protein [Gemmobacter denitrificans]|uniref:Uncharacterized protein n=1 Tax=Gemmobacter denitrificans TaxID=3123040 RepID=A0ABU8BSH9_9RHOB